jgi:hypothetical protein
MMESEDQRKKPYSPPTLTKLTPEDAMKLVADRKNCAVFQWGDVTAPKGDEDGDLCEQRCDSDC